MKEIEEYYFENDTKWRAWPHENHSVEKGIYLIFYAVSHKNESMRW